MSERLSDTEMPDSTGSRPAGAYCSNNVADDRPQRITHPGYQRPGDNGLGRPAQPALDVAPVSEEDWPRVDSEKRQAGIAAAADVDEQIRIARGVIRIPPFIRGPLTIALMTGSTALLGLFLVLQLTSTLALAATLPMWYRVLIWTALGLLSAAVAVAAVRLALFCRKLHRVEQISIPALQQIAGRSELRKLVHHRKQEAVRRLKSYLQQYEVQAALRGDGVSRFACDDEFVKAVRANRERLLDANAYGNSDSWLEDFEQRFQSRLDAVAKEQISRQAKLVAVKTAISPNSAVDVLIAAYCGMVMLGDLCRIYGVRLGATQTALLLAWIFFNAYVAGQSNELEDAAGDQIERLITESPLVGVLAGKVGARTASGVFNWFLMRRLGRVAMRMMQPVQPAG